MPARTSSMPSCAATALAVVALSPVAMTIFKPSACSLAMASARSRLDRIGDGDEAGELAVARQAHHRLAVLARRASAEAASRRDVDAALLDEARIAEKRDAPVDGAPDALPVTVEISRPCRRVLAPSLRRRAGSLRQADARCRISSPAARRSTSSWVKPGAASTPVSVGLPKVSVPVLSTTRVSTEARRSSAAALRTSTPACAPRPVATMIEIGVASPSAQGQAMMSTLTAATSA